LREEGSNEAGPFCDTRRPVICEEQCELVSAFDKKQLEIGQSLSRGFVGLAGHL
jgi:hypothetical protein